MGQDVQYVPAVPPKLAKRPLCTHDHALRRDNGRGCRRVLLAIAGFLPALVKSIRRSFPCRHPTTGGSLKGSPAGTPLTHRFLYYPYSTTAAAVCQPSFCPGPQPAGRRDGPSGEFARNVGLSNRLDGELVGRASEEGPHGEVVGAAVVDRKLLCEIVQRIECVAGIEALLVLTVAALHLTVVPRGIRAYQLMPDGRAAFRRAN